MRLLRRRQQKEAAAAAAERADDEIENGREPQMQYCDITEKRYTNMQTGLGVVIKSCFNLFCAARLGHAEEPKN